MKAYIIVPDYIPYWLIKLYNHYIYVRFSVPMWHTQKQLNSFDKVYQNINKTSIKNTYKQKNIN